MQGQMGGHTMEEDMRDTFSIFRSTSINLQQLKLMSQVIFENYHSQLLDGLANSIFCTVIVPYIYGFDILQKISQYSEPSKVWSNPTCYDCIQSIYELLEDQACWALKKILL